MAFTSRRPTCWNLIAISRRILVEEIFLGGDTGIVSDMIEICDYIYYAGERVPITSIDGCYPVIKGQRMLQTDSVSSSNY